ncbi:MAG: Rieske 2Fe-2S domain-containing protein [Candidatus Eisenbacteria bacterium]|uniref:Rieske 2Fe-2S domain-containing protein n=1 Tax=Eiseniibacteriota bacterium TaxID=2212470 RepID=A0A7Y2H358_UNCEI|nr:Rieske 2Fe-2S domain-containing protein [Candidatus Eisenbacteria bacterium]
MSERFCVGSLESLSESEGTQVEVHGCPIAVFKKGQEVFAIGDTCPHMGAPLSDGFVDEQSVVCPWHGWSFDFKTGESPFDEDVRVPVYQVVIEGGQVYLEVEQPATEAKLDSSES